MTAADTNTGAPAVPRFLGVEELRGWCATAEGRQTVCDLLSKLRTMRTETVAKEEANLATMRSRVAKAEANVAEFMARIDRQIQAVEAALSAAGELQA